MHRIYLLLLVVITTVTGAFSQPLEIADTQLITGDPGWRCSPEM